MNYEDLIKVCIESFKAVCIQYGTVISLISQPFTEPKTHITEREREQKNHLRKLFWITLQVGTSNENSRYW